MSRVPAKLRASLVALMLLTGLGGGMYYADEAAQREAQSNAYIHAVASDPDVSDAIRIAMVMASFYESSNRHVGKPYVDRLGKGRPLTVCNGLTGPDVIADKTYSPAECYRLEKRRYIGYEAAARRLLPDWNRYDAFVQATFLDFFHNKGEGNFATSTMRRKALAGDLVGACLENPRWNRGTVNGVSTVLPGLVARGESNDELCRTWRADGPT